MEKQINFLGVNLTPYSDISPDGGLAACVGLERHAGSLRPVVLHGTSYALPEDKADVRLLAVHDTAAFNHFIFRSTTDGVLYWADRPDEGGTLALIVFGTSPEGVSKVSALGNTLAVLTEDGMHFYLWQAGAYVALGAQMPHLPLTLGLRGMVVSREEGKVAATIHDEYAALDEGLSVNIGENEKETVTMMASLLNERLALERSANHFVWPFFARWGYETAFGDMLFSPPVLMIVNAGGVPNMTVDTLTPGSGWDNVHFRVSFLSASLDYHLPDVETWKAELEKWKDIITGISFYVSDPISAYDQEGEWAYAWKSDAPFVPDIRTRRAAGNGFLSTDDGYSYYPQGSDKYTTFIQAPMSCTVEEYYEKFRSVSVFWKVSTVKLGNLEADALVSMEANTLANLGTQEHIKTEALNEHDALVPRYSFVYNQRLHIANVTRRLHSFPAETLATRWTGQGGAVTYRYAFYIYCNDSGGQQVVKCEVGEATQATTFHWLYYPNPSAYRILIEQTAESGGAKRYAEVTLKEHPMLNGAYWFSDFEYLTFQADASVSVPAEQPLVDNPNKIYISEVGAPFYFPTTGINTVGVGDILGLASVTTALSQGQFGQFPLMVFCSDGNYALQVSSEGLFSNVSPMQRDVCTNPDSITQTDGLIIFVSAKGAMTVDGSNIRCISEVLDGVPDEMATACITPPRDFFQSCLVAYDYAGCRLIFFSKDDETAWLMSLEDASWSQARLGTVAAIVNVYPYSYIQLVERHEVLQLDKAYPYEDEMVYTGKLLTRPLKLDSLQLKSIHQFALEGNYSHVQKMTLYASNDGRQWFKLGESTARRVLTPGRYFKYYRIGIDTSLTEAENLSGVRVDYALSPERRYR